MTFYNDLFPMKSKLDSRLRGNDAGSIDGHYAKLSRESDKEPLIFRLDEGCLDFLMRRSLM